MHVDSVHFTQIPDYSEELINPEIEATVKRMQDAIETGRLIRDRIHVSMKYPLRRVKLVDADQNVLNGFKTVEKYIKEELNCLELEFDDKEDEYVLYSCKPDHREIGSVLKQKFNKAFKTALTKLTNEQLKQYLKEGKIEVCGSTVQEGWLKIDKAFKPSYKNSKQWAC